MATHAGAGRLSSLEFLFHMSNKMASRADGANFFTFQIVSLHLYDRVMSVTARVPALLAHASR